MENNLSLKTIKVEGKEIVVTDSREVAEMTGKEHKQLLKDVRKYIDFLNEGKISPVNFFIEDSYLDSKRERRPCYQLTKQGCEMVANKMTGKKGVLFTATYVKAFNDMQEQLKSGQANFASQEDIMIYQLEEQKKIKRQLNEVNHRALATEENVERLEKDFINYKENECLSGVERDEITSLVKSIGVKAMGGKETKSYKNKSLRSRVYANIHKELRNQFDVPGYKYIKRKYFSKAKEVIYNYRLTIALREEIDLANSQVEFKSLD